MQPRSSEAVIIDYTNHRGERSIRRIIPIRISKRTSLYHAGIQWILDAYDVEDDMNQKDFAMSGIHDWKEEGDPRQKMLNLGIEQLPM